MEQYAALLKAGWRMNDIDSMDAIGYLCAMAWSAGGGTREANIDELNVFGEGVL